MLNYVVLHHQLFDGQQLSRDTRSHYDWLFEQNDALWTWATQSLPPDEQSHELIAMRLPDHRKAYLTYEGVVSGDRGYVSRVESGTYEIIEASVDRCQFKLSGPRMAMVAFQRICSEGNLAADVDRWYASFRPVRVEAS